MYSGEYSLKSVHVVKNILILQNEYIFSPEARAFVFRIKHGICVPLTKNGVKTGDNPWSMGIILTLIGGLILCMMFHPEMVCLNTFLITEYASDVNTGQAPGVKLFNYI